MKKSAIERLKQDIDRETEILVVSKVLACAWRSYTSRRHDAWTQANPSLGQSDVTALLVQRKLGGEIFRAEVAGHGTYYYNVLPEGRRLDLTQAKFPKGTPLPDGFRTSPKRMLEADEGRTVYRAERLSLLSDSFDYVLTALDKRRAA